MPKLPRLPPRICLNCGHLYLEYHRDGKCTFVGREPCSCLEMHRQPLTARELAIVRLVVEGKQRKEIAAVLNIAVKTVEVHRGRAASKLGVHSTHQLIVAALKKGIVNLDEVADPGL